MEIILRMRFKDGTFFDAPPEEVYSFKERIPNLFDLIIKGKLDNRKITLENEVISYDLVKSVELIFIE